MREENEMLLKEMTETKLKNIALERASYDLMQSQDFMIHFQRENDNLKQEIVSLETQIKQKDEEISSFEKNLKENLQLHDDKINEFESLLEKFLLVNAENERLLHVLKDLESEIQGYSRDFISKQQIQVEIDEIMRKFLRERELFEGQLEKLIDENKDLLRENEETKRMNDNYIRILNENENKKEINERYSVLSAENKRLIDVIEEKEKIAIEEKNYYKKMLEEKEKFHEIDSLKEQIAFLTTENQRILSLVDEKNRKINEGQRDIEIYMKQIQESRDIIDKGKASPKYELHNYELQGLQAKMVLINAENDRLFEIIEEKDNEIENLIREKEKSIKPSNISEETTRLYRELDKLREENARIKVQSEGRNSNVLQESRQFKENLSENNQYVFFILLFFWYFFKFID